MGDLRVTINDERYVKERALVSGLAALYVRKNDWKLPVAILCDDYLDPTGRLLGLVRDEAVKRERWRVPDERGEPITGRDTPDG